MLLPLNLGSTVDTYRDAHDAGMDIFFIHPSVLAVVVVSAFGISDKLSQRLFLLFII